MGRLLALRLSSKICCIDSSLDASNFGCRTIFRAAALSRSLKAVA
jgi:hypothetical protein